MKRIGLTGGIGTGKSTVASVFECLHVPVFHADNEARKVYEQPSAKSWVVANFGDEVADSEGNILLKKLALKVFQDPQKLELLNAFVHPWVKEIFESWCDTHSSADYILHEAAILFESGFNALFDKVVVVTAPRDICLHRVMERDRVTAGEVQRRMDHQWPQEKKDALADFLIRNSGEEMVLPQVLAVHRKLLLL